VFAHFLPHFLFFSFSRKLESVKPCRFLAGVGPEMYDEVKWDDGFKWELSKMLAKFFAKEKVFVS
jgi:hypothetical protein